MKRLLIGFALLVASSFALAVVNINTATREELDALPGIGPVKAQAIIDYRNTNGAFKTPQDVMKVRGIKEGEYGKIKDEISVSGTTTVPAHPQSAGPATPMAPAARSRTPAPGTAAAPAGAAAAPASAPASAPAATPAAGGTAKMTKAEEKAARAKAREEKAAKAKEEKAAKAKEKADKAAKAKEEKAAKADAKAGASAKKKAGATATAAKDEAPKK